MFSFLSFFLKARELTKEEQLGQFKAIFWDKRSAPLLLVWEGPLCLSWTLQRKVLLLVSKSRGFGLRNVGAFLFWWDYRLHYWESGESRKCRHGSFSCIVPLHNCFFFVIFFLWGKVRPVNRAIGIIRWTQMIKKCPCFTVLKGTVPGFCVFLGCPTFKILVSLKSKWTLDAAACCIQGPLPFLSCTLSLYTVGHLSAGVVVEIYPFKNMWHFE